jgi:hypothetical protein
MALRTGEKWRGRAAGLVALVVTVGACGSGTGGVSEVEGVPVVPDAIAPARAGIGDGFTVAPGAALLGRPAPTGTRSTLNGVPVRERGWFAVLLVTGDPYRVLDHYFAEAAQAGIRPPSPSAEICTDDRVVGFECRVSIASDGASERPPTGASLELVLARHDARRGEPPASHLLLRYSRVIDDNPRPAPLRAPAPVDGPPAPPLPARWPALLRGGNPIPPAITLLGSGRSLVVEPGSELVAPLAPFAFCLTGGFAGVFAVTEPAAVVAGYERQFQEAGFDRNTFGDVPVSAPAARFTVPGGGDLAAETVAEPGQPTYVLLTRCND